MPGDPEIDAMQAIAKALETLDDDARARVIEWAGKRYGVWIPKSTNRSSNERSTNSEGKASAEFVDLFDQARPKSESERALVGGYWFQLTKGQPSFTGGEVNNALKDLGHGISNVTVAINVLQEKRPALVRQISKSGKAKQARKTYKLTSNGISAVEKMITGGQDEEKNE